MRCRAPSPAVRTTARTSNRPRPARAMRAAYGEPDPRAQSAREGARPLAQRAVDVLFPALEQSLARVARSELAEIVVDHLDVRELGHLRRQCDATVRRDRVFLDVETDLLTVDRQ